MVQDLVYGPRDFWLGQGGGGFVVKKVGERDRGFAVSVVLCYCRIARAHSLGSSSTVAIRIYSLTSFRAGSFRLYREE